jgi:coenzyme F420-reducing hydrogenase gamma subunit
MNVDIQPPKPKIAFFDFTSCEGCQLTVLDSLQTNPELLEVVDIVEFREAMTGHADRYDIAFIEGSCTRASDEERLSSIRARAKVVVALGACAHIAGINAIRNNMPLPEVRKIVYGDEAQRFETYEARPISAVIPVDFTVPGCPINPDEFLRIVVILLQGRGPELPDYPVCIECKVRETVCVYQKGRTCLGPITRAGCQAICPSQGYECVGCRGLISNPNLDSLAQVMVEHGLSAEDMKSRMSMFLTWQMQQRSSKEIRHE